MKSLAMYRYRSKSAGLTIKLASSFLEVRERKISKSTMNLLSRSQDCKIAKTLAAYFDLRSFIMYRRRSIPHPLCILKLPRLHSPPKHILHNLTQHTPINSQQSNSPNNPNNKRRKRSPRQTNPRILRHLRRSRRSTPRSISRPSRRRIPTNSNILHSKKIRSKRRPQPSQSNKSGNIKSHASSGIGGRVDTPKRSDREIPRLRKEKDNISMRYIADRRARLKIWSSACGGFESRHGVLRIGCARHIGCKPMQ